jgi:hypothetical protein
MIYIIQELVDRYGWEDVEIFQDEKEAAIQLKKYRETHKGTAFKLIKKVVTDDTK